MGTRDQDTDPSTPGALRGLANTDPTPNPATHVSTDPGLGPPSQPATPAVAVAVPPYPSPGPYGAPPIGLPAQGPSLRTTQPLPPMGIVVPASAPVPPRKDSVELLLDGMQGPQPARPRTTPQTGGESHAAYHARHVVHSSRTSPDEEPKVVVERAPLPQTMKIDRARVQAVIEQAEARRRMAESTAVLPQRIAPRVILAVVAGLLVVLALFVVLRLTARRESASHLPSSAAIATPAPQPAAPAPSSAASPTASSAEAPAASAAPAPSADTSASPSKPAAPPMASAPWWAQPSAKPRPKPTAAPTGDLGDYQTKFR